LEVQGHDDLLKLGGIRRNGLGLFKLAESVSGFLLQVAVRVHGVEGLLERVEVLEVRVARVLENTVGPLSGRSGKIRDDK